jgi:hypothetical protein
MKLKATLAKSDYDALPEGLRAAYVEKDGKFTLEVDGMIAVDEYDALETKVAEFRDNNRKLHKQVEDLTSKYKDVDPDKYRTLQSEVDKLQKAGIKGADDIEARMASAVEKALAPVQARLDAEANERTKAQEALAARDRDDALWTIGAKAGVKDNAKDEFLHAARKVWQRGDNGELIAREGERPLFSKQRGKASEPLSLEEWATQWLPQEKDFLYKKSGGGGQQNDKNAGGSGSSLIANDPMAIGSNLEAIAKGSATVAGVAGQ